MLIISKLCGNFFRCGQKISLETTFRRPDFLPLPTKFYAKSAGMKKIFLSDISILTIPMSIKLTRMRSADFLLR